MNAQGLLAAARKILMSFSTVILLTTLACGLCSLPFASSAQPAAKVPRIGYLSAGAVATSTVEVFRQRLRELGYVDGRDIVLEERWAEGQVERLPVLAAELVRLQVQVIFAGGPTPLRAAMQATATIPIVAIDLETDPVAMGFAASLARPGGNVTGVFLDLPVLSGKQLELLREAVPGVSRVAVLWDPATAPFPLRALEAEEMARHAATYVGRILRGAMPAELLIERPTRFELVVNLKTAETLGLTVPPVILLQAHEVIR